MTIINILLVTIFLVFCIYLYNVMKEYFPFIIPILFMHTWMLLSVAYLEEGRRLANHNIITYYTGATYRLVILEFIFFVAILIGVKSLKKLKLGIRKIKIKEISNKKLEKILLLIIFVSTFLLFLDVIISGNKLTNSNITRFNFYTNYSKLTKITWTLSLIFDFLQCVNGMLYVDYKYMGDKCKKYICLFLLLCGFVYKYLMGVEFGGYFYMIVAFMIPSLVNLKKNNIRIFNFRNIVLIILGVSLILSPKIAFFKNNTSVYASVSNNAFDKFIYRALGLQGEMWWSVDKKYVSNEIDNNDQIEKEILAFIDDEDRFESGIWYLSYLILPGYDHKNNNATLNCGYPAINLALFGYFGAMIFQFINGLVFSLIIVYLHNVIVNKRYLTTIFACGVWFMLYNCFYMGGLWYLGGSTMKTSLIAIIGIELIIQLLKRSK